MARWLASNGAIVGAATAALFGCSSPGTLPDAMSDATSESIATDVATDRAVTDAPTSGMDARDDADDPRDSAADADPVDVDDAAADSGIDTGVDTGVDSGVCAAGSVLVGDACVAIAAPRPVWPLSLGDVTQRRPTLRWVSPMGVDGAVIELCRDRSCSVVIETIRATGTSARPSADLPARSVVFWRLRGRVGSVDGVAQSATWLFRTPVASASSIDTAVHAHFDVNGDGFDDLATSAIGASTPTGLGVVYVRHGGPTGISATVATRIAAPMATAGSFGSAINGAGDVNGDGYADLVVGNGQATVSGSLRRGVMFVYFGGPSGLSTTPASSHTGGTAGELFGASVNNAGDVDRDGYGDVIVGSPERAASGSMILGAWQLFRGSPSGLVASALVSGGMGSVFSLGASVASAGDVNGDGFNDVIVGATRAIASGRGEVGSAFVHHGSATGIETVARTRLDGDAVSSLFGATVRLAGDVNGDGYSDVMVSAPTTSPGSRMSAGSVFVFHGGAAGVSTAVQRRYDGALLDRLGEHMIGAADFNGDGFSDVALGNRYANLSPSRLAPVVRVVVGSATGLAASVTRTLSITDLGSQFGRAFLGGDVNGDGLADLVVGAPLFGSNAGAAFVFHGTAAGIGATENVRIDGASAEEFATQIAH